MKSFNWTRWYADRLHRLLPGHASAGPECLCWSQLRTHGATASLVLKPGTDYTVSMGVGYAFSPTPIHTDDTFTLDIRAENVFGPSGLAV